MLNLSKFVSLAFKFQIFDLSKFVSLAYCHSTMRGKRPKIIDVDLLSDVSSPKCHSPKSPRIKEEELDDIEEMQVEAQVEEDVMGLSDAESDEVEEEEEASNVSFFVIFLTNLQRMTNRPLQAGVGRPSTAMHI